MKTEKKPHALPLNPRQKQIIAENKDLFAADIIKLPGMENTSKRQVSDYQRELRNRPISDAEVLAASIRDYIEKHGLPAQYNAVFGYVKYLENGGKILRGHRIL